MLRIKFKSGCSRQAVRYRAACSFSFAPRSGQANAEKPLFVEEFAAKSIMMISSRKEGGRERVRTEPAFRTSESEKRQSPKAEVVKRR